jgi:hypothetical protein
LYFFLIKINSLFLVGFEGKQYHRACFICQNCKNEIGTSHFFKTKDGKYICQDCSLQQQQNTQQK